MRADKARLPVGATPLAVHVARRLERVCEAILLASGDGERLSDLGYRQVADVEDGPGPLAGIVAGLQTATTELVAVVAVDMPLASADVLRFLADRWNGEHAVIPTDGERLHPLHAVYAASAAGSLLASLRAGTHAVRDALEALDVTVVGPEGFRHLDPTGRFLTNVNEPGDLGDLAGLPSP